MAKRVIICADCEGTPDQIERIWEVFTRRRVRVNFFFTGETALQNKELLREMARTQNIDSHTFSHAYLRALSKSEQRLEILKGKETVEAVIGRRTCGFRAPFHAINRDTVAILNEEGFVYDLSGLYYRYAMGDVIEIRPNWFREWTELYEALRFSPGFAWGIVRALFHLFDPLVIPVHPHYSGRNDRFAAAMEDFITFAAHAGAEFCLVPEYLRRQGLWRERT